MYSCQDSTLLIVCKKCYTKFAELIVRECITVCENGFQCEFTAAGIRGCVNDLKKQFGIEE